MKRIFLVLLSLFCLFNGASWAEPEMDAFDKCMKRVFERDEKIRTNIEGKKISGTNFIKIDLDTFQDTLINIIDATDEDSLEEFEEKVLSHEDEIYLSFADVMFSDATAVCRNLYMDISKIEGKKTIGLKFNDKTVGLMLDIQKLLNYTSTFTGIVVTNKDFKKGDTITKYQMGDSKSWSDNCSDYTYERLFDSVRDSDPLNKAGQSLFGRPDDEFFLDEPEHLHAFPGLVLIDVTHQDEAERLIFQSLDQGLEVTTSFARALKGTQCKDLNVYYVLYSGSPTDMNTKRKYWGFAAAKVPVLGQIAAVGIIAAGTIMTEKVYNISDVTILDKQRIL